MKKALWLHFFCLVLLTQCEVWNQPMIFDGGDQANGLRAIHTIFIKTLPDRTVFTAEEVMNEGGIFTDEMWYAGLEVYGVNGLDEMRMLLPEEYLVEPVDTSDFAGDETVDRTVTVKLNAPDRGYDITTEFTITILKIGEKYYTIRAYPGTNGAVIASPSFITDSQFDDAGDAGVSVDIIVRPADRYKFKEGSLAYSYSSSSSKEYTLGPPADGKYKFTKSIFESNDTIYLYAEFELAEGVVEMNGVYYDALEAAIDVITADPGSDYTIRVVTGFSLSRPITIPDGRNITITLTSNDSATKTISGNITVGNGGTLRLLPGLGGLIVNGQITLSASGSGSGSLVMAGAVSVKEVKLEGNAVINISAPLSSSGNVPVTKITTERSSGVVLQGVDGYPLTDDDCARFVVEGFAIKLVGNTGVLVDRVASRWVGGVERYYESIQDAVTASSGTSTNPDKITVLKSIEMTDAVTINDRHVKLVPRFGSDVTLTRKSSFTVGSLFTINSGGNLVLEGNGLKRLVIDGNGVVVSSPLINVSGGSLTINTGAELQNNKNTNYGDGVGGGVYVISGLFTMKGGTISGNTASDGGAGVYVASGGSFTMSGGTIGDNGMAGTGHGGGVSVYDGSFTMSGGTIGGNQAYDGGGVSVYSGTFTMSGGTIRGNTANGDKGSGVYVGATFTVSGSALVAQDNNVYLPEGKVITVGSLSGNALVAKIKPAVQTAGIQVLEGATGTTLDVGRFILSDDINMVIVLDEVDKNKGVLSRAVASRKVNGTDKYYDTVQGAVNESTNGSSGTPDTITLLGNITVDSTITINNKHVKLVPTSGATVMLARAETFKYNLFEVESGSLTLAGNDDKKLVLDGNGVTASAPLIKVLGGSLTMEAGVTLQNNNSSGHGGGVHVTSGSFTMNDGAISGNTADKGGGVYVTGTGSFEMKGGTIGGSKDEDANTATTDGGGVYVAGGRFTVSGSATVAQHNDVYLVSGKWITVGKLDGNALVAKITPKDQTAGTTVLERVADVDKWDVSRFTVSIDSMMIEEKDNTGVLAAAIASREVEGGVTKYYSSIQKAVTNSGGNSDTPDTITVLTSITVDSTSTVSIDGKYVTLVPKSGSDITLTRAGTFKASLFTVTSGSLTLAGNGDKNLVLDGNNVTASAALIEVLGGSLTMEAGVGLQNNKNSGNGGGVYVEGSSGSSFTMSGGTISGNTASSGGGVYVTSSGSNSSSFTMSGGTISGNTASSGGGVYVTGSGSSFTMSGGTISGNKMNNGNAGSSGAGAGVYVTGDGNFTMGDSATISDNGIEGTGRGGGVCVDSGNFTMSGGMISGNQAWDGGGVDFRSNGTFMMTGGSIKQNKANPSSQNEGRSGGVSIDAGSFTMSGGTISGNTANGDRGSGVYVKTTFTVSDSATVDQNNNVYLASGKFITVGVLTGSTLVAKITPATQAAGTPVLKPADTNVTLTEAIIDRFTLSINMMIELSNEGNGVLTAAVASREVSGSTKYYPSIQAAVDDSGGTSDNPDTITVLKSIDIDIDSTVSIDGEHVKLVPKSGSDVTLKRASKTGGATADFTASLFNVTSGSLTLAGNGDKELVLDGNNVTASAALVTVSGGSLKIDTGVGLQNNKNSGNGGGVHVTGSGSSFTMSGGTISGNTASSGGGVYVTGSGSSFTMNGGTIKENTAGSHGGGVYVAGGATADISGGLISKNKANYGGGLQCGNSSEDVGLTTINIGSNATISANTASMGGGINIDKGTVTMDGGTVKENAASQYTETNIRGGGLHINNAGTFNFSGGSISSNTSTVSDGKGIYVENGIFTISDSAAVDQDNDVYLASGKFITVGALTGSTLVAKITPATQAAGTPVLKPDTNVTLTEAIIDRFTLSIDKLIKLSNEGNGVLADAVASREVEGGPTKYYPSIQAAVEASGGTSDNPDTITVLKSIDIDIDSTVSIDGEHVKLVPKSGSDVTLKRASKTEGATADFTSSSLFTVTSGSLTLAGNVKEGVVTDKLVLDGNKTKVTATAALITVSGGSLTINTGVTLQNNKNNSNSNGGGVYVESGKFTMSGGAIGGSTTNANQATNGGGVYVAGGTFTMSAGTISYNEASYTIGTQNYGNGGGVYVTGTGSSFTMSGGTISGNTAKRESASDGVVGGNGGGVYIASNTSSSDITFTMSGTAEISDNTASNKSTKNNTTGGNGGGVYVASSSGSSTFTMSESAKIRGNKASNSGSSGSNGGNGGGVYVDEEIFNMQGGTIGGSTANDANQAANGGGVYVTGSGSSFTMSGGTISGNKMNGGSAGSAGAGAGVYVTGGGNFTMKDSATISDNGMAGAGHGGAVCADGGTFAMEGGTISDNKAWNGGGVDVSNSGTFTMEGGEIKDNEATGGYIKPDNYDGDGGGVHVVSNSSFTMSGGTISGNKATGSKGDSKGGGVYVGKSGKFEMKKGAGDTSGTIGGSTANDANQAVSGGGVYVTDSGSSFTMKAGTISGNTATNGGGGVYVTSSGSGSGSTFTMSDGTISGNKTTGTSGAGGGVYVSSSGKFKMSSGTIGGSAANANQAVNGGGVYVTGSNFEMSAGTISYNEASYTGSTLNGNGGGVYVINGTFTMSGSGTISNNKASNSSGSSSSTGGNGGGVYLTGSGSNSCTFTMSGGTISDNSASNNNGTGGNGGGVYVKETSQGSNTFTMSDGTISGNTAQNGNGGGVYVEGKGGEFTMSAGTISGNKATSGFGGGVYVGRFGDSGTFTKTGSANGGTIYGSKKANGYNENDADKNTANGDGYGHAVYVSNGGKKRNKTAESDVALNSSNSDNWE